MFSAFTETDGTPSWNALLEQACIFQALTFNLQNERDNILSVCGGGTVLAWQWGTGSWPPSMTVIRQGNVIFVQVTGTENLPQLYGDIIGVFADPFPPFGCKVHSFFLQAWQSVRGRLVPNLPSDWRSCEFRFFGHSLGAAVAFLGASEWKRDNPSMRVDFLASACPKSLTTGYNAALPTTANFVASPDDVVPLVPSNGMNAAVAFLAGLLVYSLPFTWVHYATPWILAGGNAPLQRSDADTFNRTPGPIILATTAVEHFFQEYLAKIALGWSRFVGTGQDAGLLPIVTRLQASPVTQTLVDNIGAWNAIDVAAQNRDSFNSAGPGPLTEGNLDQVVTISGRLNSVTRGDAIFTGLQPEGNAMGCKLTYFMRDGAGDFTESWYLAGASAPDAVTAAQLCQYIDARMDISGGQTSLIKVRVSTVDTARQVRLWYPQALAAAAGGTHRFIGNAGTSGHSSTTLDSDFSATSLLCRKLAGLRFSRLFLRGIPDDIVQTGGRYAPYPYFVTKFNVWKAVVVGGYSWRGVLGTQPAPSLVTAAVTQADASCLITVADTLFTGKALGSKLVVRINGQKSPANLNGSITVSVVSPTQCRTVNALSVNNFSVSTGYMTIKNVNYIAITDIVPERIVAKKAGRPTDQSPGRSRRRVRG